MSRGGGVSRDLHHLTPDRDLAPGPGGAGATRLWPYTQGRRTLLRRRNEALVDPVNLLVLGAGPERVMAALAAGGWHRPGDGAVHRIWLDGRPARMTDHTALGDREARVHLRLWAVGPDTVGAAHQEVLGPRGRHRVISWDAARAAAARDLERAGFTRLATGPAVTRPGRPGVAGDGRVWRLAAPAP